MRSADYTRLAQYLPAVYADDAASFVQVDAFLGLVDELNHAYLERLEDHALTLGPDAALRWPVDLPLDAGGAALTEAYLAVYDEVAAWAATAFPPSWTRDEDGVAPRRELLARTARIWRRRGTPRGFLDWFCLYFQVASADRPYLLEHFKVPDGWPEPELTGTLFVPSTEQFSDYRRRHEAIEFVNRYAPAHVLLRVCWARPDFELPDPPEPPVAPELPAPDALETEIAAYLADLEAYLEEVEDHRKDIDEYRKILRTLICDTVSFVDHPNGIQLWECVDSGRAIDRLGVGRLPTDKD